MLLWDQTQVVNPEAAAARALSNNRQVHGAGRRDVRAADGDPSASPAEVEVDVGGHLAPVRVVTGERKHPASGAGAAPSAEAVGLPRVDRDELGGALPGGSRD